MHWLVLLASLTVVSASLLQGDDQQPIVDGWVKTHPLDGRYVVLLRDAERTPLPAGVRVVSDQRHADFRLLVAQDHSEAELRSLFPGAVSISADCQVLPDAVWNLDRLDERELAATDGTWTGPANGGSGVHLYVVDSGVDTGHPDFGGRADTTFSAYGSTGDDCGHGTHVAGVAGGAARGVARGAAVHSVKVLNDQCSGTLSALAQGLLSVAGNATGKRAVINLSLGFNGYDSTLDAIVQLLLSAGHVVVAAAGNDAGSACIHYPSAYAGVLAVAATDDTDSAAGFSNWGSCVDVYAPGVAVEAAQAYTSGYTTLSGTSMSAPHIAGVAALLWQETPSLTGSQVAAQVLQTATQGAVSGRRGSPNLLSFWVAGGAPQSPTSGSSSSSSSSSTTGSDTQRNRPHNLVVATIVSAMMTFIIVV